MIKSKRHLGPAMILLVCVLLTLGGGIGHEEVTLPPSGAADVDSTMTSFLIVAGGADVITTDGHGPDGFEIQVTNRRSGEVAEGIIGEHETGIYEVIFVDLNNNPVAIVGDTLTFVVSGAQYFYPYRHILTLEDIMSYRATVNMQITVSVPDASWNRLGPCYPNPFNPRTAISFSLDKTGWARLRLYDVAGKLVRTLVDEVREEGEHRLSWDGTDDRGLSAASGGYFLRLESEDGAWVRKLTLLR